MGEIWVLIRHNFRRLLTRPRFYAALVATVCSLLIPYYKLPAFLAENNLTSQFGEPFILVISSRITQWLLTLSFLLLAGDAPFLHDGMDSLLIRTNKRKWLTAQILYMFGLVVVWLVFVELVILVLLAPNISFANKWSVHMLTVSRLRGDSRILGLEVGVTATPYLIHQGLPLKVFGTAFVYGTLLFFYFGMWGMFWNLLTKRSYGCLMVTFFLSLRFALYNLFFSDTVARLSPANLVDLCTGSTNSYVSFRYTVCFFLIQIVVLAVASQALLRRRDMSRLG